MRDPGVERHVAEHARAVEESRLRGDDEERRLGDEERQDESGPGAEAADVPVSEERVEEHRVHRLPFGGRAPTRR